MKIAILGAGKMGSWLAGEFAREHQVTLADRDPARATSAPGVTSVAGVEQLAELAPDLLINAVSLSETVLAFEAVVPKLPQACMLADVASIKGELPRYYQSCGRRFVSVHPMFGPTFADMDALRRENAIVIKESDAEGAALFRNLFSRLGVTVFDLTFAEHDRMMAYSLTTPFAASLVFAACVDETVVPGTTFARHLTIARGLLSEDDQLLAEVLFNPHSLDQLRKITSRIEFLKHVIADRDQEEARRFFATLRKNVQ
ncbi:MAG: prephenate dehydrogenase [Acidobacteria bacterium]|nr:prephenate dehydrogenase [Acidobacteriota bacterium]